MGMGFFPTEQSDRFSYQSYKPKTVGTVVCLPGFILKFHAQNWGCSVCTTVPPYSNYIPWILSLTDSRTRSLRILLLLQIADFRFLLFRFVPDLMRRSWYRRDTAISGWPFWQSSQTPFQNTSSAELRARPTTTQVLYILRTPNRRMRIYCAFTGFCFFLRGMILWVQASIRWSGDVGRHARSTFDKWL